MSKNIKPPLVIQETQDGSFTLTRTDLDETYHSLRGAKSESEHVFIAHGLSFIRTSIPTSSSIKVLEVGFGTGLNALLTQQFAEKEECILDYHSLEPLPVPEEIYNELNYGDSLRFLSLHQAAWDEEVRLSNFFTLNKYLKTLEQFESDDTFDIVFMDAFAPSKQPEIWHIDNLKKCFDLLNKKGILITYCAQGQFKRDLKSVGFEVEILPGALGKKEMVRAHRLV